MNRARLALMASLSFALLLGVHWNEARARTGAQDIVSEHEALDQYLMADRNDEIALARSAAPESISGDAKIMVLGRHGYETAVEGKNGFVCVVERAWMSPADDPGFWNPNTSRPNLFQSTSCPIRFTGYFCERTDDGISRANEGRDHRRQQDSI